VLVLGLLVGSFLNVVIYRVPIMLNREWRAQCAELAAEDAAEAESASPPAATEDLAAPQPAAADGSPRGPSAELVASDGAASDGAASDGAAPEGPAPEGAAPPITAAEPEITAAPAPEPAPPAAAPRPAKFNLMEPRSACPACGRQILAIENIPVISWLFLRGRCAGCGIAISWRYPAVELLTGLMSAAVAWKLGLGWPLVGGLVFTWFLIALTFIDIDTQLLPDNMTLPLVWLGLFASVILPSLGAHPAPGEPLPSTVRDSVIGAIAGYLSLWLVYHAFRLATGKEGMGYGDFKLLAAIGAWLGWQMVLPTILISAVLGAVVGITTLSIQKKDRSVPIAFGPFLAIAGWTMLMFGPEIVSRYMGLFR
jgi:leader peptidase (prepilin peptidase) / N-methyltransferase